MKSRREHEQMERELARAAAEREEEILSRKAQEEAEAERMHDKVEQRLYDLRVDHEAKRQLAAEVMRQRPYELPPKGWTADTFLEEDDEPLVEVVEGLHYRGNNTLLVAEFKTGKTTMEVNLAGALADGEKFLGQFETNLDRGRIAVFNYEMDRRQFRHWLRDHDIENLDRIIPLNLRGWQLPFWGEEWMLRLAEWLNDNEVAFMFVDPAARAWRGLVEHEGDNVQLGEFFGSLDELKRLGGCDNLLIAAHTPRADAGRSRGGGEIEAWPDGNWYLGREKTGVRSLRAEGRDIAMDAVALDFDEDTKRLTVSGSIDDANLEMDVLAVKATVKSYGEFPSRTLLLKQLKGMSTDRKKTAITECVERGLIEELENGSATGYRHADTRTV